MLKITGAVLVLTGCTAWGMSIVADMNQRIGQLQELLKILGILESEIAYANGTLMECFYHVAERTVSPFRDFFRNMAEHMEQRQGEPMQKIFHIYMEKELYDSRLLREDLQQLESFGQQLGYLDRKRQTAAIALYRSLLEESCRQAKEDYHRKAKIWRCMGITGGLFLIILLM